jgi:hypothetical protein
MDTTLLAQIVDAITVRNNMLAAYATSRRLQDINLQIQQATNRSQTVSSLNPPPPGQGRVVDRHV